ncbi:MULTISPECIES: D-glucuronyl C5-epimerase family protein [Virgibacillus]|uniref:D-glucuronyl C5-epimerase family protein n=1 Tax=Virgibacillus TaxID=84406 RepID=UPI000388334B|nr:MULTISPECIES: D-glucuronyl C5-epimerase family protein [Virgibacillus]EQB38980.1 hypothetical protein M948_01130 [Virgibacillus sp. CM-4]MYL43343.1 hypothetical protein [Virgibacillus massiliensis]
MESGRPEDIRVVMHQHLECKGKKIGNELFVPITLLEKGYFAEKEWIEGQKLLKIHVSKARYSEINQYDFRGNYLHYDKNGVENWSVEFHDGIPKTVYPFGTYFNPSTIAQYGLQHYSLYLKNKDEQSKQKFLSVAAWFLQNQNSQGGWAYQFDHAYYPSRLEKLKAPWYSSIGLGMAMSVLARASYLTKNTTYQNKALQATSIFQTSSNDHGILAKFEGKYSFYEECPTNPPSYILNGFMFALIGLYDLHKQTGNRQAGMLYEDGVRTLKRMLPLYDLGNRTAYDLTHYTTDGGYPNIASWGYHVTHIHLLAALNSVKKDPKMSETLQRWKGYIDGKMAR